MAFFLVNPPIQKKGGLYHSFMFSQSQVTSKSLTHQQQYENQRVASKIKIICIPFASLHSMYTFRL
jgi:hypothetical protein